MIRYVGAFVFVCVLFSAVVATAAGDRPNIVLIMADDMGFSDLGCYGSEILTPNLDRLARNGLRFTQFYNCARCCPTRAALLTGMYPHQAGIGHMTEDYHKPGYRGNLNRDSATIAELLAAAGYQTMMTGKWHVTGHIGPEGPKFNWPTNRGFEKFYGTLQGAGSYFQPVTLCRNDRQVNEGGGNYYYTDALSDQAGKFIEEAAKSTKPFFLYMAYTAPHWPLHAPAELIKHYRGKYSAGWDALRDTRYQRQLDLGLIKKQWALSPRDADVRAWEQAPNRDWQQRRMEVYAAQIDALDQGIGRVMEKLKQLGLERNTLVMFLADNGGCAEELAPSMKAMYVPKSTTDGRVVTPGNQPNLAPGGDDSFQSYGSGWANASNTPFRRYKHWVHEGGISTPLIVYWPQMIQGGVLVNDVGHVIDIVPTCLEAAKFTPPKHLGGLTPLPIVGKSLLPLFLGKKRETPTLFWEHEGNRAVRDGKWKLVSKFGQPWELYDMDADRTELNDLAKRFPVLVKDLSQQYDAWAKSVQVEPWPVKPSAGGTK